MSKYSTAQRKALLAYLFAHTDELLSAREIARGMTNEDISLSAVYRNLSALEAEGSVRRASKTGSREAYYQYVDTDCCKDKLHLSCTKCGRTFHMDLGEADTIVERVSKKENFIISKADTILYGICSDCEKH